MERFLLWLTIPSLVIGCATHETTTHPVLTWHGQTVTYDSHFGSYGGYHFSNGVTALWDPALGPHGGVRFSTGETAEYDPSLGPNGGYRFSTGATAHHVPSEHGGYHVSH
jgi:hypothetical protein